MDNQAVYDNKLVTPDTIFYSHYSYLNALYGKKIYDYKTEIDSFLLENPLDYPFKLLDSGNRYGIVRLMTLCPIEIIDRPEVAIMKNKDGHVLHLTIKPRALYRKVPVDYLKSFDSLKRLEIPLCPEQITEFISELRQLDELYITALTSKSYILDLSGIEMSHLSCLYIHAVGCEGIIFPKNNKLETLSLSNCKFHKFDDSFKNLKELKRLICNNIPLQRIELKSFSKLDTIVITQAAESPASQILLVGKKRNTYLKEYLFRRPKRDIGNQIDREFADTSRLYKKQIEAIGCK